MERNGATRRPRLVWSRPVHERVAEAADEWCIRASVHLERWDEESQDWRRTGLVDGVMIRDSDNMGRTPGIDRVWSAAEDRVLRAAGLSRGRVDIIDDWPTLSRPAI